MAKRPPRLTLEEKIAALQARVDELKAGAKTQAAFSSGGLRKERQALGLTAQQYGDLLGVSMVTVYSWEKGRCRPRSDQFEKWLAVRGISKEEAWKKLAIDDASDFSAKVVVAERKRLGLTQRQYGDLVGVGALAVLNWEHGKRLPRRPALKKWRAVKGISKAQAEKRLGLG